MGRGRLLQLLDMSLPPCCPYHPAGVLWRVGQLRHRLLPSPRHRGLGLPDYFVSRPLLGSLSLRPGDSLTVPKDGFVSWLHPFRFLHVSNSSYGAPDSCPGGTISH